MPIISKSYQDMLMKAGPETCKEALKHEAEWLGWGQKMVNRVQP